MADTATVVATVLLIAFVIDRIVAALMFTTDFLSLPRRQTPEAPETAEKRTAFHRRFVWFFIAAVLSGLALTAFDVTNVRLGAVDPRWNWPLLWLILVGGADRISQFLATPERSAPAAPARGQEFRVEGTLTLDEETARRLQNPNRP